ncbi:MAG: DUF3313 family protein [Oceanospirillaceae bacterium]
MLAPVNKLITLAILLLAMAGCANNTTQKTVGFLGNYAGFVDSKEYDFTKIYTAKNFNAQSIAKITDIKLEPFELWLSNNSQTHFNPQQLSELSRYFQHQLSLELRNKNYRIIDQATATSLTVRGAFSNIKLDSPDLSPLDFIPFRIVVNAGNSAYLKMTDRKDVITALSIEAEFLQGIPQKRVFALIASKEKEATILIDDSENLTAIKKILDTWAINFAREISRVRDSALER